MQVWLVEIVVVMVYRIKIYMKNVGYDETVVTGFVYFVLSSLSFFGFTRALLQVTSYDIAFIPFHFISIASSLFHNNLPI